MFRSSSFSHVREARSYQWTFLEGHFNCCVIYFEPYSLSTRSMYSSDIHSFALFLRNLVWESFTIICLSSDLFISLDKTQGPIYDLRPLPLHHLSNHFCLTCWSQFWITLLPAKRRLCPKINKIPSIYSLSFLVRVIYHV